MNVSPYMIELFLYEQDEEKFLKVLESFSKTLEDASPRAKRKLLELFSYAMAHLANMRKDLIHPMLSFGREVSIRFSPLEPICCQNLKSRSNVFAARRSRK